jgi:hypothetical protein
MNRRGSDQRSYPARELKSGVTVQLINEVVRSVKSHDVCNNVTSRLIV